MSCFKQIITLFNIQISFHGPSKYDNEILEKLHRGTQTQHELHHLNVTLWGPTVMSNVMMNSSFNTMLLDMMST